MSRGSSRIRAAIFFMFSFAFLATAVTATGEAEARPKNCFGKKINRVVHGNKKTVRLKYRDVA